MHDLILHNPSCSKSRAALALLQKHQVPLEVTEYLLHPPSTEELAALCRSLGGDPKLLIRAQEQVFTDLGLSLADNKADAQWLEILHQNPLLLQRPIVRLAGQVIIARPPERVLELIHAVSARR